MLRHCFEFIYVGVALNLFVDLCVCVYVCM